MKLFSALAMLACLSSAALADPDTKVIQGCEVKRVENGNYYNLVDRTCRFGGTQDNDPSGYRLADFDSNPATPETFGYVDR